MDMERFNSNEDIDWHPEAASQGRMARLNGFEMNSPKANQYLSQAPFGWMYKSFCAGWVDADMDENMLQ